MDLRPPLSLAMDAFSVPAVVTLKYQNPVTTRATWITPLPEDQPVGRDYSLLEPRRVLSLPRDQVPDVPKGTLIAAVEKLGGASRNWQIDGIESAQVDEFRVFVIPQTGC